MNERLRPLEKVALILLLMISAASASEVRLVPFPAPRVALVKTEKAVFRVGPTTDHDRRTPLERGVRLQIIGQAGTWLLADLGAGDRGWVEEKDVTWSDDLPVECLLRNILIRPASGRQTFVDVQLSGRASFDLFEAPHALVLRLHRTTSTMNELAQYDGDPLLGPAEVHQVAPDVVELRLPFERGPWGWGVSYGASPNLPGDPPGHDFTRVAAENLRIALAWPPGATDPRPAAKAAGLDGVTVVLDPGHGGPDSGAVGVGGLPEKDVNLRVALAARDALVRRGARVVMTRDTDRAVAADVEHELSERVDIARAAGGNVFVSIHHNARPRIEDSRIAHGVFVYYYQPWSGDLARALMDPIADVQNERVRAYVFRSFAVIRQPYMPSVLIEAGFISNPDEERKMRDPAYARRLGEAVAEGVARFVDGRRR
jgi:N-acetylmuramoyl-L-alanine amidase